MTSNFDQRTAGTQVVEPDEVMARLTVEQLERLQVFCDWLALSVPEYGRSRRAYLDITGNTAESSAFKFSAGVANGHARMACTSDEPVLRRYARRALQAFRLKVGAAMHRQAGTALQAAADIVPAVYPGPEEDDPALGWLPELDDGAFVVRVQQVVLGRGCRAAELRAWCAALQCGRSSRADVVTAALNELDLSQQRESAFRAAGGGAFSIMGTGQRVTEADWRARGLALALDASAAAPASVHPQHLFIKTSARPLVSVITSLYRGGDHIARFLANMVEQSCFVTSCELIVVDADSPDGERALIERCAAQHKNVQYLRMPSRIGIYEAWNIAVERARGVFVTNANVDDLRRRDSLELQAATLDNLPFVDVVYQDFYYTMDPTLGYDEVAAYGYKSELPVISPAVLMRFNPPHHAPMWRRSLHDELGLFDASYQSAGDYEFWLRCLAAGKTFFKLNAPHAVYYQNPQGMSTRADTRGHVETRRALNQHGRRLVSQILALDDPAFERLVTSQVPGLHLPQPPRPDRYAWLEAALRSGPGVPLAHGGS